MDNNNNSIIVERRITVIQLRKPGRCDINEDLQWIGTSLGLFNLRDRDKSCFRIFIELLKTTKNKKPLSSDEIAYKLNLSRGTVIHHLKKLSDAGIVSSSKNRYLLRSDNLSTLIGEIEKDMKRTYEDLKEVAALIDKKMS